MRIRPLSLLCMSLALALGLVALFPARVGPERIRVGVSPVLSSAGVFLALEKGYFRQEGLQVELIPFRGSGPEMIPLLASGRLEVAGGNLGAGLYNALARGIRLKVVADKGSSLPGHGYLRVLLKKGLSGSGQAALRGGRIAVPGRGVSQEIVLDRYLAARGLGASEVRWLSMPYQDAALALARGSIDATLQIEPFLSEALACGEAEPGPAACDLHPYQQSAAILYGEGFTRRGDVPRRWMRAYLRGVRDYRRAFVRRVRPGPEIQALVRHVPVKDPGSLARLEPVGLHPDGALQVQTMREDLAWYVRRGFVSQAPTLDRVIDLSYAREAAMDLGPEPR